MFRKTLLWAWFMFAFVIAGLTVTTMLRQHLTYEAPYPDIKATSDMAMIEKGKNIALNAKGCARCHSAVANIDSMQQIGKEPALSGAKKLVTSFGTFFTPNITPDAKTGIGSITDAQLARVLRYGVKRNNEAVLPFMQGLNLNDEELTAVISYLRAIKPVENKVPEHQFTLIGRLAKAYMAKPAPIENSVAVAKNF
ncbi:MAG TPA: c-type cytochrome [Segetibacter sp.]